MWDKRITVIIPHIPTRTDELLRALASVEAQTHRADDIIIATDNQRAGSALTRNRALHHVSTNWVAFLDDDDEFLPNHLETLITNAINENAQVVYTGCRVMANGVELPLRDEWGRFGQSFDADELRRRSYIPVTSLVNARMAQNSLFFSPIDSDYDDWGFYLRMLDKGAKFLHVPEVTWIWHHHGANTSGRPDRW